MVPEMEKPPVTEIKVRMDCNGCVQKIKKALHRITGIEEMNIDFSEQKITIIGCADPETIIKAIKKTRKKVIICLHKEQSDDQPLETTPEVGNPEGGGAPPPEPTNQPEEPAEAPQEQPRQENPPLEANQPPEYSNRRSPSAQRPNPNDQEEGHVTYHQPPDHGYQYSYGPNPQQGYNGQWNANPGGPNLQQQGYNGQLNDYHGDPRFNGGPSQQPQPVYVAHSYNTYKPSPYVTKYAQPRSPQPHCRGNPLPEEKPSRQYASETSPVKPKDPEVHVIYHQPPDYGYRQSHGPNSQQCYNGQQNTYQGDMGFKEESSQPPQPPVYVTQRYNTSKSSTYVTEYANPRSQGQPRQENPLAEAMPLPEYANGTRPSTQPSMPKDPEKVRVIYHQPPDCGPQHAYGPNFQQVYNGPSTAYHGDLGLGGEPSQPPQPPIHVTQSYNTNKPLAYATEYENDPNFQQGYNGRRTNCHGDVRFRGEPSQPPPPHYATQSYNTYKPSPYVTDYAYPRSPPRYLHYSRPDYYSRDYYSGNYRNEANITSMFSEENPNACTIV